jgi:hypothetical protein
LNPKVVGKEDIDPEFHNCGRRLMDSASSSANPVGWLLSRQEYA